MNFTSGAAEGEQAMSEIESRHKIQNKVGVGGGVQSRECYERHLSKNHRSGVDLVYCKNCVISFFRKEKIHQSDSILFNNLEQLFHSNLCCAA